VVRLSHRASNPSTIDIKAADQSPDRMASKTPERLAEAFHRSVPEQPDSSAPSSIWHSCY